MASVLSNLLPFDSARIVVALLALCSVAGCGRSSTLETTSVGATENAPVVRTDFSDDKGWKVISGEVLKIDPAIQKGFEMMKAVNPSMAAAQTPTFVDLIDDRQYDAMTTEQVLALVPKSAKYDCLYIVDQQTISQPDHPVLVVDLRRQRGRTFRTVPSEIQSIESNLSISNVDWEDFADHVDASGVYRGVAK